MRREFRGTRGRAGFTLIELLVVLSILLSLSLAITASLVQGVRIVGRLVERTREDRVAFFFERLTRDLRNSFESSQNPPVFSENALSFTTLTCRATDDDKEISLLPTKVSYLYDIEGKRIVRTEDAFCEDPPRSRKEVLLEGLSALSFKADRGVRQKPVAVSILLSYQDGPLMRTFRKSVLIPVHENLF